MDLWDLILIAVALSMDAFAAGMSDGMAESDMPSVKHIVIAFAFGLFQFLMPVAGYYAGSAFAGLVAKIAPYLSFAMLGFIGGRAVVGYEAERRGGRKEMLRKRRKKLGAATIFTQAVATSMDALAVGVTMLAAEKSAGLPFHAAACALLIGLITFSLSLVAVRIGQRAGNRYAERAELIGGFILILIGTKLLLEGLA